MGALHPGDDLDALAARAVAVDGGVDGDALAPIEAELVEREDWAALAWVYERLAPRADAPDLGRGLQLAAGLLKLERLGDGAGATEAFRRVLASDPECFEAWFGLASASLGVGDLPEALRSLERALEVAPEDRRLEIALEIADRAARAGEVDRALSALGLAAEDGPGRARAVARARALLTEERRWTEAISAADEEAELEGEAEGTCPRALADHLLAHPVFHEAAERLLERARAAGDEGALAGLDALAAARSEWAERAQEARHTGQEARDKRAAAAAHLTAGELAWAYGADRIASAEHFDRALLLMPADPDVLEVVGAVEAASGRGRAWRERVVGLAGAAVGATARRSLWARAWRLAEGQLADAVATEGEGSAAEATARGELVELLARAHAAAPGEPGPARRLAELYGAIGRFEGQIEVLERHAEAVGEPGARFELHLELGRLALERFGDVEAAVARFEAALALRPRDAEAASLLAALYRDVGRTGDLARMLSIQAEHAPDRASRDRFLAELQAAADEAGEPEQALEARLGRFALHPEDGELEVAAEQAAENLQRLDRLAETHRAIARLARGERRRAALRAAARLLDRRLGRAESAASVWRAVLAEAPGDEEALEALERLAMESDDPEALAALLAQRAAEATDETQRAQVVLRQVRLLYDRLDRREEAIELLSALVASRPEDPVVLRAAVDLYETAGHPDLEGSLRALAELNLPEPEREAARLRLSRLLLEDPTRAAEAAERWRALLPRAPEESASALSALLERLSGAEAVATAQALIPVLNRPGDTPALLRAHRALATFGSDPALRVSAATELAQLAAETEALEASHDGFVLVLSDHPEREDAAQAWVRFAERHPAALADARRRLEGLPASVELSWVGARFARQAGEVEAAEAGFREAASAPGGHREAERDLRALLAEHARWAELDQVLAAGAGSPERSEDERVALGLELGRLRAGRLGDRGGAADAFRAVLALEPGCAPAMSGLADALDPASSAPELLEVLDRLRAAEPDRKSVV